MNALFALTVANIRSYTRDRAAVFWTLAFPLVFIVLFGLIFQGSAARLTLGWVDNDKSEAAVKLKAGFAALNGVTLVETTVRRRARSRCRSARSTGSIVVPVGYGASLRGAQADGGGTPVRDPGLHRPVEAVAGGLGLPGGRDRARRGQPRRTPAARRTEPADRADRRTSTRSATSSRACSGCRSCRSASSRRSRSSATARS